MTTSDITYFAGQKCNHGQLYSIYRKFVAEYGCCEICYLSCVMSFSSHAFSQMVGVMPLIYWSVHCTAIDFILYLDHKLEFEQFVFCMCLKHQTYTLFPEPQMCSHGMCYHWTVSEKLLSHLNHLYAKLTNLTSRTSRAAETAVVSPCLAYIKEL